MVVDGVGVLGDGIFRAFFIRTSISLSCKSG